LHVCASAELAREAITKSENLILLKSKDIEGIDSVKGCMYDSNSENEITEEGRTGRAYPMFIPPVTDEQHLRHPQPSLLSSKPNVITEMFFLVLGNMYGSLDPCSVDQAGGLHFTGG
jgi:hypothetical protein